MRKAKPTSTDHSALERERAVSRAALTTAIEKQREQLFQVQAVAGALGVALQESCDTLDLEHVTRVIVDMLDDTIEALEPAVLFGRIGSRDGRSREQPASGAATHSRSASPSSR